MKKILLLFFILIATGTLVLFLYRKNEQPTSRAYEIGERLDSLNHVVVYYNGGMGNISGRNTAPDGYNIGLK